MNNKNDMDYYLLTSLGVRPQDGRYKLENRIESGNFSSSALVKLLEQKPKKVFVLLTSKAREKSLEEFQKEIGLETEIIDIPDGVNDEEIKTIIRKILMVIPEGSNLILDISQGFRHFPFLFFTSVLYLQSFRGVNIHKIYYGMYEKIPEYGFSPIIELGSILEMVEWYHSVKDFSEMKLSGNLAKMIDNKLNDRSLNRISKDFIEKITIQIKRFDDFYGTGLPMGIGDSSKSLINQFKNNETKLKNGSKEIIPLGGELFKFATKSLEDFKLVDSISTSGKWKEKFKLDYTELERQCRIIDSFFTTGHYVNAIRLMREWIISRCTLSSDITNGWLKRSKRAPVERLLGSIRWQAEKGILVDDKKELASIWDSISKYRNEIAHNGMNEERIDISRNLDRIEKIWKRMKELMHDDKYWDLKIGGEGGKLLITPFGFSKGLLYSAIKLINPDNCIIITSKEAASSIPEIMKKAGYIGNYELIDIIDPHTGYNEIKDIINTLIPNRAGIFLDADEIIINLTGGTTTLQVLVDVISHKCWEMGKDPNKVIILDKRDAQEQRDNPYVTGEIIYLEDIISCSKKDGEDD